MSVKQTKKEAFLALFTEITETFSKGDLNIIYNEYLRGQILIQSNNKVLQPFLQVAKSTKYPSKDDIAMILTHLIIKPELLTALLQYVPEHVYDLMKNVVWVGPVPAANPDIKKVEDVTTLQFSEDSVLPSNAIARPEYSLMAIQEYHPPINRRTHAEYQHRFLNVWFYLPPIMTKLFKQCIPAPETSIFELTNHTDEYLSNNFYTYQNENRTSEVFTELSSTILNEISISELFFPGALDRKKARSMISLYHLPEFYPEILEYDTFSFQYISWLILHVFNNNTNHLPTGIEAIQYCYASLIKGELPLEEYILHFVHDNNHHRNTKEFMNAFPYVLKLLPSQQWIQVDSMIRRSFMHGHVPAYYQDPPIPDHAPYLELSAVDKPIIDPIVIREAIHPSLFKGVLAIMASLGIIDILLQKPSHYQFQLKNSKFLTPADGIAYVRLTEIGEYIIGKKKQLAPSKKKKDEKAYLLDDQRLIITVRGDIPHRKTAITPFSNSISANVYMLNAGVFLKGCHSVLDIEKKIKQFKQIIQQDVPEHFSSFLQQLIDKANPLIPEPLDIVFKLKQQGELAELFAQDAILKSLIKRAEGFRIIIAKTDVFKLKKRLEELGYFMD